MEHERLIDRIMELDDNIRYATICDMKGNVKVSKKRDDVETYLSPDETHETLTHAVSAWKSRMKHYDKIGKGLYTLSVYEKLRRVTLPLKDDHLLLVTIGIHGGNAIIERILSQLHGDFTEY